MNIQPKEETLNMKTMTKAQELKAEREAQFKAKAQELKDKAK